MLGEKKVELHVDAEAEHCWTQRQQAQIGNQAGQAAGLVH